MKIKTVTITGADDNTNIEKMIEISNKYPFVEWGILFSPKRIGKNRYPSENWVLDFATETMEHDLNTSAHVCGNYSQNFVNDGELELFNSNVDWYAVCSFQRMQLNFNVKFCEPEYDNIVKFLNQRDKSYIIQYNKSNKDFCNEIIKRGCDVQFLHDGSGGRCILPSEWEPSIKDHFTGYAGGLNPENIAQELHNISTVTSDEIWIDVESGVRTNDVLDFDKVEAFLKICQEWN